MFLSFLAHKWNFKYCSKNDFTNFILSILALETYSQLQSCMVWFTSIERGFVRFCLFLSECKSGWKRYNGHCYYLFKTKMNCFDAQVTYCGFQMSWQPQGGIMRTEKAFITQHACIEKNGASCLAKLQK